jgi:hypothetical protein
MSVRWELENNELRIDPSDGVAAWTFKNVGDEAAYPGFQACTVTIWKQPDGTPWTRTLVLPGSDAVEPDRGVPMTASLAWDGQEPGDYMVRIDFNENEAMSETAYHITEHGHLERYHGF